MNVLVTGAGGFIGSYLASRLDESGYNVIRHKSSDGDLLKCDSLNKYLNVDIVYHLAGKTYVPESWEKPYEYINTNNAILLNVLDFCRKNRCRMVYISTYLYGEPEYLPVDEKHKSVATSPYHLGKKLGEDICEFYSRNYDLDIMVLRPFNVYGKGQNEEFLLPKIFCQVMDKSVSSVEVFDLDPRRDYIYVEDFAEIMVKLIPYIKGFDVYNVGSGVSVSVKEVIDIIQAEFGTNKQVIEKKNTRRNEIMDCYADIRHLEETVGQTRLTTLDEGIHRWRVMECG